MGASIVKRQDESLLKTRANFEQPTPRLYLADRLDLARGRPA